MADGQGHAASVEVSRTLEPAELTGASLRRDVNSVKGRRVTKMPSNFGFVIEGVLAGMERPGSYAALQADLAFLKENGIRAIVSLTESPLDTQAVEAAGFAYLHVPVGDFRAPSIEQVDRFVAFQETHEKEGAAVVVHCGAGRGRTGTMLACALVKRGMGAEEALRKLREIRPHSVETPEQEDLVQRYEVRLARRRKHGA